ncbi:MAG: hypothetical protein QOE28_3122, partial [Solirubrobacteraceae bacterium]|nr:hypothetical protein [Solirubrobacteraceae bacterium]
MASKRDVVLAAARAAFAAHGYDRATYRGIASAAGVDPSLVVQFYGAKPDLFAAATALPEGSGAMLAERLAGDPARAGERVAAMVVAWLAEPATRDALVARVRAAA